MSESNGDGGSSSAPIANPVVIVPGSTLILKPVSEGEKPLILVPTTDASGTSSSSLLNATSTTTTTSSSSSTIATPLTSSSSDSGPSQGKKDNKDELPRPNWSRKRFVDKIQLMKGPSPYDIHTYSCNPEKANAKKGRKAKARKALGAQLSGNTSQSEECLLEPVVRLAPGFSITDVEHNSAMCFFYTGFHSYKRIKELFERLHLQLCRDGISLSRELSFLLCLIKLRTNKDFEELGFFFNISTTRAQDIFEDWMQKLHEEFQNSVFWTHRHYILQIMNKSPNILSPFFALNFRNKGGRSTGGNVKDLDELLPSVKMYKIIRNNPRDDATRRMAMEIIHVCFSLANYHLYPNYLVLLS